MSLEIDDVRAWLLELHQLEAASLLSDAEFEYTYIDTAFRLDAISDETDILELGIRVPSRIYRSINDRYKEHTKQIENAISELSPHIKGDWIRSVHWLLRIPKLEEVESTPVTDEIYADSSLYDVQRLWTKAKARTVSDPDGAITASKTMLESLCKLFIKENGGSFNSNEDLTALYRKAISKLDLAPGTQTEDEYRKLAGACATIINSISCIRNRESDSHATSQKAKRLHAKFVVNVSGSIVEFLVGIMKEKKNKIE